MGRVSWMGSLGQTTPSGNRPAHRRPPAHLTMAKWIQHYRDGHYAEVWQEMQSLGADIGRPAHAKAAREVAHETMQRARQNVLSLIDGLLELGYRFDGPAEPTTPDYPLELRIASTLDYVRLSGGKR